LRGDAATGSVKSADSISSALKSSAASSFRASISLMRQPSVRATTANISAFTDLGSTGQRQTRHPARLEDRCPGNPARVATIVPNGPSASVAASSVAGCAGWRHRHDHFASMVRSGAREKRTEVESRGCPVLPVDCRRSPASRMSRRRRPRATSTDSLWRSRRRHARSRGPEGASSRLPCGRPTQLSDVTEIKLRSCRRLTSALTESEGPLLFQPQSPSAWTPRPASMAVTWSSAITKTIARPSKPGSLTWYTTRPVCPPGRR